MLCFAMALAYISIITTKMYMREARKNAERPRRHYKTFDLAATKLEKKPES